MTRLVSLESPFLEAELHLTEADGGRARLVAATPFLSESSFAREPTAESTAESAESSGDAETVAQSEFGTFETEPETYEFELEGAAEAEQETESAWTLEAWERETAALEAEAAEHEALADFESVESETEPGELESFENDEHEEPSEREERDEAEEVEAESEAYAAPFDESGYEALELSESFADDEHSNVHEQLEAEESEELDHEDFAAFEDEQPTTASVSVILDQPSDDDDKFRLTSSGKYDKTLDAKSATALVTGEKVLRFEGISAKEKFTLVHERSATSKRKQWLPQRYQDLTEAGATTPSAKYTYYPIESQVAKRLPDRYGTLRDVDKVLVALSPSLGSIQVSEPRYDP